MIVNVNGITGSINRYPGTIEEEVYQNVRILAATERLSVPLDRGLGIDADFIDAPVDRAMQMISQQIMEAVARSEPRAEIRGVDLNAGNIQQLIDGNYTVSLIVRVKDV